MADDNQQMTQKESQSESRKFISGFIFLSIAAVGILIVLYAWRLPPFLSYIQSTENAMVRGQITLISPQLSRYVTSVFVQDFQHVKKGDLLVQIDERIYRQKYDQAKAQLAVREAALENNGQDRLSAEASIRQAEAALSNAQAQMVKTRNDYKRISELVSSGAVSKSAYDSAKASDAQTAAQTLQTEAALEIAKQNLQSIIIKHASLEAEVENAKAALELARIDLDNTRIIAPGDGQLGQVSVRLGAYVTAGTQLTGLVPHHVWVIANMKETQMANIRIGQPAVFTVDALDHAEMHGHVERIAPASGSEFSVIPPDNATGNFVKISQRIPVRISVDPDQALSERLKPGMSVVVSIETKD
jgi:multidrug resistance efflux pump